MSDLIDRTPPFEPPERFNLSDYLLDARLREGLGDEPALLCEEGVWSYQALWEHTQRCAHLLIKLGLRPEERVLVSMRDSADFAASLLGVIKAGGVVVMINPELDADRLAELLHYSRARYAFVEASSRPHFERAYAQLNADPAPVMAHLTLIEMLGGERATLPSAEEIASVTPEASTSTERGLRLSHYEQERASLPSTPFTADTHRDDPAVWLFSGGTTGRPKAIVQPHRSFVYTTERYAKRTLGYRAGDRVLSVPKLYFGYATGAILFFPLSVGASAILFPDKPTPARLFEQIDRHKPTLMINVPTLINRMLSEPGAEARDLSSLRAVTSAGEALPVALHERWDQRFGVPLYDGLGTAEMWHIFLTNSEHASRKGTLGQVVEGFEVSLRSADGAEVSVGEAGVMWVKGGARATEYWQQREASELAFQGSWYASGDLMRRDEDGFYTYCGRQDDMIKVAGKWVSPKEVEDALMAHEGVKECAVIGSEDEAGLLKAFAYVIPRDLDALTQDPEGLKRSILGHLEARLDRYKLPKSLTLKGDFKRTHLGKIDRGALR